MAGVQVEKQTISGGVSDRCLGEKRSPSTALASVSHLQLLVQKRRANGLVFSGFPESGLSSNFQLLQEGSFLVRLLLGPYHFQGPVNAGNFVLGFISPVILSTVIIFHLASLGCLAFTGRSVNGHGLQE